MAINVQKKTVKAEISKSNSDGTTETTTEDLAEVVVPTEHAIVSVEAGITRNLGNYESLRYTISLSLPCAVDPQDIEDTYATAKEWVDEKLTTINQEVDELLG